MAAREATSRSAAMVNTVIVIPCYNEANRLEPARFVEFARKNQTVAFLFVDDGSSDGTDSLLDGIRRALPEQAEVLRLERNSGKAEAVRQGVLRAMDGGAPYVGYWDADLATPLEAIPEFVEVLDRDPVVEFVFGARVQLLGRRIKRKAIRHYMGRVFATAVSVSLRLPIYDTQCGAKLLRSGQALRALFQEPFRTGWIFDVEIVARLICVREGTTLPQAHDVIREHPLQEWREIRGSKVGLRAYGEAVLDMVRIWRTYLLPLRLSGRETWRPGSVDGGAS